MPNMDGTGPLGKGPATGWGRGNCVLDNKNNYKNNFTRFNRCGINREMGYGLGLCNIVQNDKEILLAQKTFLEKRLELINEQLKSE